MDRSKRPEVRNPVLTLPSMQRLQQLPPDQRELIAQLLADLAGDANDRAQRCWSRHKAPMAAYWKAVSVYAGHLKRAIRPAPGCVVENKGFK